MDAVPPLLDARARRRNARDVHVLGGSFRGTDQLEFPPRKHLSRSHLGTKAPPNGTGGALADSLLLWSNWDMDQIVLIVQPGPGAITRCS